ncbi:MAG: hypothetical protein ACOCZW_00825 [Bacteroidota bacterium]
MEDQGKKIFSRLSRFIPVTNVALIVMFLITLAIRTAGDIALYFSGNLGSPGGLIWQSLTGFVLIAVIFGYS